MKSPERRGPRLELKFLMDAERAAEILEWARARMDPDPHAKDPGDPTYIVESIYFDTPNLDCLRRNGRDCLPKYRARYYNGDRQSMFLEEKLRQQQQVWKRRLPCGPEELAAITRGPASLEGAREWFRTRFRVLQLQPCLVVVYQRTALVAGDERLTLDRRIEAKKVADGDTEGRGEPRRIVELDVLELKHPPARSKLMRKLAAMAGQAEACSKYARGMRAFGYGRNGSETATA